MQTALTIPQGATWTQVITWLDPSGVPIDVTDYEAEMQLRASYEDCFSYLTLSTAASSILVEGASGEFTLYASATTTAALIPQTYVYDLDITSPGGVVTRLLEGTLTVTPRVTRL